MTKIKYSHRPQSQQTRMSGFTLTEMLISSAISLILIAGVLTIAMGQMTNSAENLKRTHLIQEMRDSMAVMVRDIRRAGFNAGGINVLFKNNDFTQGNSFIAVRNASNVIQTNKGSCITYAYDYRDHVNGTNGTLDIGVGIDERSGFRLKNGAIQMFKGTNGPADCSAAGWEGLTSSSITITKLEFDADEQCFNVSLVSPPPLASCTTVIPAGNIKAKLISMVITITAETIISGSAANGNLKTVTRTITDSVTVRNSQTTLSAGP